jgi:hypothetical protein
MVFEIQEQKNALQTLKNDRAGFQLQIQAIDKQAADKTKAEKDKSDAEALKKQEEFEKEVLDRIKKFNENKIVQDKITDDLILRNRLQNILDTNFKAQQEIEINRQNEIDKQLEAYNQGLITEQQYNDNKALINSYYDQQQLDAIDKINSEKQTKADKAAEDEKKTAEALAKEKIKFLQDVANATGALSDVIGKETAVGKGLAVAQATINTYLGASEVIKAKSVLPEPLGTISKVVNVATIIATGLKSVKGILSTKVPGGGGGGGNLPSLPSPSTTAPIAPQLGQTALNQQMINATGNAAVRAFVLETDVSGNQERIKRLNRAARIN